MSLNIGAVAGLFRMVIDHEIDAFDLAREVVGLDVHHRDALERVEVAAGVTDSTWMSSRFAMRRFSGARDALDRADDRRRLGAAKQTFRRARPLAIASGSGSLWGMIEDFFGVGRSSAGIAAPAPESATGRTR